MKREVFLFICGLAIVTLAGVEGRKELQLREVFRTEGGQCGGPSCNNKRLRGVCWRCQDGLSCEGQVDNEAFGVCKLKEETKTALKKEGESCGSCYCPPTYTAGDCAAGLECKRDPRIPDSVGECVRLEPEENLGPDCNALPQSPRGNKFKDGCPGAVKKNGNPARWFCKNNPWHKECCIWKRNKCSPKELDREAYAEEPSMDQLHRDNNEMDMPEDAKDTVRDI